MSLIPYFNFLRHDFISLNKKKPFLVCCVAAP